MIGNEDLLKEVVMMPYEEWETLEQDVANDVALKVRDAFSRGTLDKTTGVVTFAQTSLWNLDCLPGAALNAELHAVAEAIKLRMEHDQKGRRKSLLAQVGKATVELAQLYHPVPSQSGRPNNPYLAPKTNDTNLSYQPGAMQHRASKGR